jgi:hypothetical protein
VQLIQRDIDRLGGLARTSELLGLGHEDEWVRMAARYGRIVNAGHGWWANPWIDPLVIAARRAGGKLACRSALVFYGVILDAEPRLHLLVRANARKPRGDRLVVHWSRNDVSADRLSVSLEVALAQARACRGVRAGTL